MPRHREIAALSVLAVLLWLGVAIKAASAPLTWDEAWTYLHYARSWRDLLTLDYANNHLLHSLAVRLAVVLTGTNSEFVIRLPNVLAAGLYLAATLAVLPQVRFRRTFFFVCAGAPYLFDYFALARGYGLAAAWMQVGLAGSLFGPERRWSLPLLTGCLAAASLCIFPLAIVAGVVCGLLGLTRLRGSTWSLVARPGAIGFWSLLGGTMLAALLALALLRVVSRDGAPVFGTESGLYDAIAVSIARKNVGASAASWVPPIALSLLVALVAVTWTVQRPRSRLLLGTSTLGLAAIAAASALLHKPLPTDRVLIAFYPLWTLSALSLLEDLPARLSARGLRIGAGACGVLCMAIAFNFARHVNFHVYEDWPTESDVPAELAMAIRDRHCLPPEITLPHQYYLYRWFGTVTPPGLPAC